MPNWLPNSMLMILGYQVLVDYTLKHIMIKKK